MMHERYACATYKRVGEKNQKGRIIDNVNECTMGEAWC